MQKNNLKMYVIAIVAIGIVTGIYIWKSMSQRPAFMLQKVQNGAIEETIRATGTVVPQTSIELSFEKTSPVKEINYAVGDEVKAGAILARLDGSDERVQFESANAQIISAQAVLNQYQENLKGAKYKLDALEHDDTSKYDDKKVQEKVIKADEELVNAQKAQVAVAFNNAKYFSLQMNKNNLVAPVSGIISKKNIEVGEMVQSAKSVMTLVSNGSYKIETYVSQKDVTKLKVGNLAQISFGSSGEAKNISTKITAIDPSATEQDGISGYKVTLEFSSDDPLMRAGLTADINISIGEKSDVVVIAKKDIIQKNGESFAIVPDQKGKEVLKQVQIGIMNDDRVEIVSGLSVGDSIFSLQIK